MVFIWNRRWECRVLGRKENTWCALRIFVLKLIFVRSGGIRCFFLGEELVFLIVLWGRVGIKGG